MFTGSLVALVTPMNKEGHIDDKALFHLIDWHFAQGTDGIVVAGTTGESATLTEDEHYHLISKVVKHVARRVPVIAGTGSNATAHTITLTRNAKKAGAEAALIVTPYYNKPTQQGLYLHYQAIIDKVPGMPIILYNVPGRTACDLLPQTVARLAQLDGIIGIKEATGKIERITEIRQQCGKGFDIYSGDDATALAAIRAGANGVISVTANVAPAKMHALCAAALTGKTAQADALQAELLPLHQKLFVEANPIPSKWVLQQMGLISGGIRLPLTPLDATFHNEVATACLSAGISLKQQEPHVLL